MSYSTQAMKGERVRCKFSDLLRLFDDICGSYLHGWY
jgi:hypothetical protein